MPTEATNSAAWLKRMMPGKGGCPALRRHDPITTVNTMLILASEERHDPEAPHARGQELGRQRLAHGARCSTLGRIGLPAARHRHHSD